MAGDICIGMPEGGLWCGDGAVIYGPKLCVYVPNGLMTSGEIGDLQAFADLADDRVHSVAQTGAGVLELAQGVPEMLPGGEILSKRV